MNDGKDRLHTDRTCGVLNENGHICNIVETTRLIYRIGIGKYNSKCNIDKCNKGGFYFIKCVNETL